MKITERCSLCYERRARGLLSALRTDMKKDVTVNVVSGLDALDGDKPEVITLTTHGAFEEENGIVKITYSEQGDEGAAETAVTVLSPTHIRISRMGECSFSLDADLGKRYTGLYNTPYGSVDMGIIPSEVSAEFSDGGAKLHMKYTVEFNSQPASENTIDITTY